jgi:DNA repair protein RecN (Recombination protein N)
VLLTLAIRNFVIVDELELEFAPGFTVLSGETGAGKSILIDALLLALGERAEPDVVREGATRAEISAEFRVGAVARQWLREAALDTDGDAVLLRRTVDATGRSKAFVNGSAVTLVQLRELGELLVDVHGQHAHQSLLRPAAQLQLLDEHGGLSAIAAQVAELYHGYRRSLKAREDAETMAGAARLEEQRLRWIVEDLQELAPQPGEWDAVQAEHSRLSHAASLLEGARAAVDALAEADGSALARIDAVSTRLAQLTAFDERLQPVLAVLETARIQVDEAARELNHYLARTEIDDERLARVESRVSSLHAASRRFKCAPSALPALLAEAHDKLSALAASGDIDALRASEQQALAAYLAAARTLSKSRAAAAQQMGREVTRAMQDLSLAGGRFEVRLAAADDVQPAAHGLERVEFLVAAHAGVTARPLAKVASGGELARIALAISVIAATATAVGTLIFDEVDAGIGGAVAETVGRLLKQLGQQRQVLCVTHLPQVAARGDQHILVSKSVDADGRPASRLALLERKARVEELARMLGGIEITDTTRKHAREMLAS